MPGVTSRRPRGTLAEIIERCFAYKKKPGMELTCHRSVRTICAGEFKTGHYGGDPGAPLIPAESVAIFRFSEEQRARQGRRRSGFAALTTMGRTARPDWDFLNDFKERGTRVIDEYPAHGYASRHLACGAMCRDLGTRPRRCQRAWKTDTRPEPAYTQITATSKAQGAVDQMWYDGMQYPWLPSTSRIDDV